MLPCTLYPKSLPLGRVYAPGYGNVFEMLFLYCGSSRLAHTLSGCVHRCPKQLERINYKGIAFAFALNKCHYPNQTEPLQLSSATATTVRSRRLIPGLPEEIRHPNGSLASKVPNRKLRNKPFERFKDLKSSQYGSGLCSTQGSLQRNKPLLSLVCENRVAFFLR